MRTSKGFTLIELLIVIAIIAILAAVVFVALDPLTRFQDARNARRWSDADAIISALKLDQVDNGGSYHANITAMTVNDPYMIIDTAASADMATVNCAAAGGVASIATGDEVDLAFLVSEGYLPLVPESPTGDVTWAMATNGSGYTLTRIGNNLEIEACETEGGTVTIRR